MGRSSTGSSEPSWHDPRSEHMDQRRGRRAIKSARSAGGVVFCRVDGAIEILLLKHDSGKWMLPKGTIETGESPEEVARREVREETGLSHVRVVADLGEERYFFFWRSEDTYYDKTVHYYLLEFLGGEEVTPQVEEGFVGYEWVSLAEAARRIKYKETREIVRRAEAALGIPSQAAGVVAAEGDAPR